MRKTIELTKALEHGEIIETSEYAEMENSMGKVKAVILETPDGEFVEVNGYVSGAFVMVINADTVIGRSRTTVYAGTIIGIVSSKAPKRQVGISLTFSMLKAYLSGVAMKYVDTPALLDAVICKYMMETMGLRRGEIISALKTCNRKTEKECKNYLKALERENTSTANHRYSYRRAAQKKPHVGIIDRFANSLMSSMMAAAKANGLVPDQADFPSGGDIDFTCVVDGDAVEAATT